MNRLLFALLLVLIAAAVAYVAYDRRQPPQPAQTARAQPAAQPLPVSDAFVPTLAALDGKNILPAGYCPLDRVNNQAPAAEPSIANRQQPLQLDGWAIDKSTSRIPKTMIVELAAETGAARFYAVPARVSRPDVAQAFRDPGYEYSGFRVSSALTGVPLGRYHVNIIQSRGRGFIRCDTGHRVEVR